MGKQLKKKHKKKQVIIKGIRVCVCVWRRSRCILAGILVRVSKVACAGGVRVRDDADGPGEVNYMVGIFWRENHGTRTHVLLHTHGRRVPVCRRRAAALYGIEAGVVEVRKKVPFIRIHVQYVVCTCVCVCVYASVFLSFEYSHTHTRTYTCWPTSCH